MQNPWIKDFPILSADENGTRLVYLDSAATTQHPHAGAGRRDPLLHP